MLSLSILVPLAVIFVFVVSFFSRQTVPSIILLATADNKSFYYSFGNDLSLALKDQLKKTGVVPRPIQTAGSVENVKLLKEEGSVRLAIVQTGTVSQLKANGLAAVTVLFPEVVYVLALKQPKNQQSKNTMPIVRDGSLRTFPTAEADRDSIHIFAGEQGSGMRTGAVHVLNHYLPTNDNERQPEAASLLRLELSLLADLKENEKDVLRAFASNDGSLKDRLGQVRKDKKLYEGHVVGITKKLVERGFLSGAESPEVVFADPNAKPDICIVTTAPSNPHLHALLQKGEYEIVSIEAKALARRYPYYSVYTIPKGAFFGADHDGNRVPDKDVTTIATSAMLVTREETKPVLVNRILDAVHQEQLRLRQSDLLTAAEVRKFLEQHHFHRAAVSYYSPFDPGTLASYVETLAGSKDLIFAVGAGLFLIWQLRRRRIDAEQAAEIRQQKSRLRYYLDATLQIEEQQVNVTDLAALEGFLQEIIAIKLGALEELNHEEIYSDRSFSVFMMQCANLINTVEAKILQATVRSSAAY